MSDESVLSINTIGNVPYAVRGITQDLAPIPATVFMERTVNGVLTNLAQTRFRKYRTTIRGRDQLPPAFDNIWPGMTIIVSCMVEIAEGSGARGRPAVSGSIRVDGSTTLYRPILTMLVTGLSIERDEYNAQVGWQLDAEEV
jgi:hypothetical protein